MTMMPPGDVATREELLELLTQSARGGSVPAQKALLDELRREEEPDDSDGFAALDEGSNVTPIRREASA